MRRMFPSVVCPTFLPLSHSLNLFISLFEQELFFIPCEIRVRVLSACRNESDEIKTFPKLSLWSFVQTESIEKLKDRNR